MTQSKELQKLPSQSETFAGLIERVTFHNEDNGFCVLKVKASGFSDLVTVVGHASMISVGEHITCSGQWSNNANYGQQFKAQFLKATPPTTAEGLERYLASGMIKGVGPIYAKRLVKSFGLDVFDVISSNPEQLKSVEGIGQIRAQKIIKSWQEQKAVREIMLFLHQHGVSTARAVRIYKTYGEAAVQIISDNPYQLARDIGGIGFLSADKIAQNLGIDKSSLTRAKADIQYALLTALDKGHCGLPIDELIKLALALLDIDQNIIENALVEALKEGLAIKNQSAGIECIFLPSLFHQERFIAQKLCTLKNESLPWSSINCEIALPWAERSLELNLAPSQRDAVTKALSSKVTIITGGPGVGKTTIVKCLLKILKEKDLKIVLCAPTGRAAKRLSESTGMDAKTIHRLLEVDMQKGGFKHNEDNPLTGDLFILDETSMIDVPLTFALLKALPSAAALILIGDIDQLPSVGPGQVLADLIHSGVITTLKLTEVFRQAANSKIIQTAHRINNGYLPDLEKPTNPSDFYFVSCETPEEGLSKLLKIVQDKIPQKFGYDPCKDIQILCPMNRGVLGARNLNTELQKLLNPNPVAFVERFGLRFQINDKVMQIANEYNKQVYNGDVGIIRSVDLEEQLINVQFEERIVEYEFGELDQLVLAYAFTVHKSQGSEYPVVVIPVTMQSYLMLKRNLLYTAVTRGKKLVILLGQKKAIAMAVKAKDQAKRWTKLQEWLTESGQLGTRFS